MKKNDNWIIQLRKGILEIAILSFINEKPMYGYEITSSLNKIPMFQIPNGSIYPILNRITKNHWVITYWEESNDGPQRKYYQITQEGIEILKQRLQGYEEIYETLLTIGKEKN
ncbi:PadR family transcriptional regulator [Bacillus toyonensis]|uniref:PadR family transcriptional regulator n=1 Tax=Bacillus toyonensis TaxID=155322 RepID=UPI00321AF680